MDVFGVFKQSLRLALSVWVEALVMSIFVIPLVWAAVTFGGEDLNSRVVQAVLSIPQAIWTAFAAVVFFNAFDNNQSGEETEIPLKELGSLTVYMFFAIYLANIVTGIGYMLCIIPGILLSLGLILTKVVLFKEKTGIVEALSRSWSITQGHKTDVFIILVLVSVLGALLAIPTFGVLLFGIYGSQIAESQGNMPTSFAFTIGFSVAFSIISTFGLSLMSAIEYTIYDRLHVPLRRRAVDVVAPHAAMESPMIPKAPAPPPRAPITVDSDIVFGTDANDDDGSDGNSGW